jgi:ResB protein required for cytochrome c biosynthesis
MSQIARSSAVRRNQDPLDDAESGELSLQVDDLFDRLWHLFISMRTGLALMLGIAALTLVGTVLVQAPAGLQGDPAAYSAWLDGVRPKYGGWTGILDLLGLFNVFSSVVFRGLTLLLATSILACSVNRAPRLWRQAVHPRVVASPSLFDHVRLSGDVEAAGDQASALDVLKTALAQRRFRTIVTHDATGIAVYADKNRWGPFGTVVAHLSLILVMAGAILGAGGFRNSEFAITVGSTVPVGNGTNLSVKAMSFTDSYYENGSPSDYASRLVLYDNGQQVGEQTIRVNDPLRYGDISFFQSFYGPAADVRVTDGAGGAVFENGVPLVWASTDGSKVIGQFALPDRGLTVYVVGVASGGVDARIKPGQMQFEVFQGTDTENPVAIEVVDQGKPITLAGLAFTFERERQFTGLIVARDPGAPFVWLGALLLVLGVALVFFFPTRRMWARISSADAGSRIRVAALASHDVTFETAFRSFIDDMRLAAGEARAS